MQQSTDVTVGKHQPQAPLHVLPTNQKVICFGGILKHHWVGSSQCHAVQNDNYQDECVEQPAGPINRGRGDIEREVGWNCEQTGLLLEYSYVCITPWCRQLTWTPQCGC